MVLHVCPDHSRPLPSCPMRRPGADVAWVPTATCIQTDPAHTLRLTDRHNRLNRADLIAEAFRDAWEGNIACLWERLSLFGTQGAFLDQFSVFKMARRLLSRRWVIAEASTKIVGAILGADCQVRMPTDQRDARLIASLPEDSDDCIDPDLVRAIRRRPGLAAHIDCVCSDEAVAGRGFAKAAKLAAFEHIRVLNLRRRNPVCFALGELFSIRGFRFLDGRTILLEDLGHPLLENAASLRIHRSDSRPVGILRNQTQTVPGVGELLLDWVVLAHPLYPDAGSLRTPDSRDPLSA